MSDPLNNYDWSSPSATAQDASYQDDYSGATYDTPGANTASVSGDWTQDEFYTYIGGGTGADDYGVSTGADDYGYRDDEGVGYDVQNRADESPFSTLSKVISAGFKFFEDHPKASTIAGSFLANAALAAMGAKYKDKAAKNDSVRTANDTKRADATMLEAASRVKVNDAKLANMSSTSQLKFGASPGLIFSDKYTPRRDRNTPGAA